MYSIKNKAFVFITTYHGESCFSNDVNHVKADI